MSLYDYEVSKEISKHDYPFYALVMAMMRKADDINMVKLTDAWPEVYVELRARYNAPGGLLGDETWQPMPQSEK